MKKSLALVTPWPEQHTGIADYAFDLAKAVIATGIQVSVYTMASHPSPLQGAIIHSVDEDSDFAMLQDYDAVVYQLGNNTSYHLWMLPLIKRFRGVVHIHDMVMHHIAAWLTWMQDDADGYIALLEKWYGLRGLSHGLQSLSDGNYLWESDLVAEFPLFEEYAQYATAIVVHSGFALERVKTALPEIPCFQVPQLYDVSPGMARDNTLRKIAVLGGVDPQKHLDWILEALANLGDSAKAHSALELHIVGAIDNRCEYLREVAAKLNSPQLTITFHGRVPEKTFLQILADTDLCIALRYPTMGETSAIVMRALQSGIPTIVNNIGWYAELPNHLVQKLPVLDCPAQLSQCLAGLLENPEAYQAWRDTCLDYANNEFSLKEYGQSYGDICLNPLGTDMVASIQTTVLGDCGMTGADGEDLLLQQILTQSAF